MKHLLAIVAFTVTLAACGPLPVCTPADTRCTGTLIEVCSADGLWDVAEDCASVTSDDAPIWMCCPVPADELGPAGHACLPAADACPAGEE